MITVLLTCAGSQIIPQITDLIRSFPKDDIKIIGIDAAPADMVVGSLFCDEFYRAPFGTDDNYMEEVLKIVDKEKVSLIFPGSDEEVLKLSQHKDILNIEYDCKVACSDYETTLLISNKFETLKKLTQNNIPTGKYSEFSTIEDLKTFGKEIQYPQKKFIIKPKSGRGSKGFKIVSEDIDFKQQFFSSNNHQITLSELVSYFQKFPEMMSEFVLMEYFPGDKFSSDILIQNNKIKCIVTRNNGVAPKTNPPTQIADLVFDSKVDDYVREIVGIVEFDFFLQIETGKDLNNEVRFIEANPRLDATLPITLGVGVNYYHEIIDYAIFNKMTDIKNIKVNPQKRYFRYWKDKFRNL